MKLYNSFYIEKRHIGEKLEIILKKNFNYSSRLIRNMKYKLNDNKISYKRKILNEGLLNIYYEDKKTDIKPIKMDLDIVYEDENILIVNKEPFLLTHPTLKKVDKTLANGVVYYFNKKNLDIVPRFYNRLDMNTSGLIIIAKNPETQALLQSDKTKIEKKYIALVENVCTFNEKIIDLPIDYKEGNLKRFVSEKGKDAKTKIKVIKNYGKINVSKVECELFTGRTHQIRVHLSYIGHPIIGDNLYNENSKIKTNRHYLHSYYLKILNDSMNIEVKVDIPKDMKSYLLEI